MIVLSKRQLSTEEIESDGLLVRHCRLFQQCSEPRQGFRRTCVIELIQSQMGSYLGQGNLSGENGRIYINDLLCTRNGQ